MSEIAGIDVSSQGDVIYAAASGEIDMSNSRLIARDLTGAVPNDAHGLVLDLGGVDYLDSSAVQILFELAERLQSRQQKLVFIVPEDSRLQRMLTVVSLSDAAPVAPTRDEAEALLR
jgi:anti-sigma B factor antagonist